ncbi:MAG: vWA domain-containing protein, partial [Thermodesulfobacteriota bacterium]
RVSGEGNGRILVLSDGRYTARDPLPEALAARQSRVRIDFRELSAAPGFNLSVVSARAPDKVVQNEPFSVLFRVRATHDAEGFVRLVRNGRTAGDESGGWRPYTFHAGENLLRFSDAAGSSGIFSFRLEVKGPEGIAEPVTEDNAAETYVSVLGERLVLVVNSTGMPDNLTRVLSAGGQKLHVVSIGDFRMDEARLAAYRAVILENVPVLSLSLSQISALSRFVEQAGGGLLVCGGNRSFGAGGYYATSLSQVLPVSLEDRSGKKKIRTALSLVLDRSGSMAIKTPSGRTKMELADQAAAECIRLLSSADSVSVVATDSMAHVIVPQGPAENTSEIVRDVLSIESMGGGIFVYTGLVAAGAELVKAPQSNKHVLLFADAADAEEPGDYKQLLRDFKAANITVSVVGLGTEKDVDAEFLKDVAALGGGTVYFTEDPGKLIQFFTADTITYTRNRYVEEETAVDPLPAARVLAPGLGWKSFDTFGYNLLFPRPGGDVALITKNEDASPVLAFWQRGLGRAAALALDADLSFAGAPQYPDIMLSMVLWLMSGKVEESFDARVSYEGNAARITLTVSDENRARAGMARARIFSPSGREISVPLSFEGENLLAADVRLAEEGMYRGVVEMGATALALGPMSMQASPEFSVPADPDYGKKTLTRMAELTGGRSVNDLRQVLARERTGKRLTSLTGPLLGLLLILMLLEAAEVRFGFLSRLWQKIAPVLSRGAKRLYGKAAAAAAGLFPERTGRKKSAGSLQAGKEPRKKGDAQEKPAAGEGEGAAGDAGGDMGFLSRSKQKARRRLES